MERAIDSSCRRQSNLRARCNIANGPVILKGTIHGKLIELEREPGFADGQPVSVTLQPMTSSGEGLRRSFGAWADESLGLDQFLHQLRIDRQLLRNEVAM
jgi:hypothetical protein